MTTQALVRLLLLASTPIAVLSAQGIDSGGQSGPRPLLEPAEEIALARSAAPAVVSDSASIYVLGAREYRLAVQGSSGTACFVSRDWLASIEPHCFDAEGARTILPMLMRRVEMLHQGRSLAAADSAIARGLHDGSFRLPARPAMSYMMSAEQKLVAPNGTPVGRWKPHLMLYYPYLSDAAFGVIGDVPAGLPSVTDPGRPTSTMIIELTEFVPVRRGSGR